MIWWEPGAAAWRVFEDRCPHRLAPLSEGRVNAAGLLECPYHGWAWEGSGACRRIPQGGDPSAPRACAAAFPAAVRQGLLFVRPKTLAQGGAPDEALVPVVEEFDSQDGWVRQDTFRDVPYDWTTLMENVLDACELD